MPEAYTIFGLNIVLFLFYVVGYNLRHSQIWLHFGKWASYIFISPAQHQIHHSTAMKHRDKNFGLIFSFWDRMFGTLYVPKGYEAIDYGINKEEKNPFKTTWELYVMPFKWSLDGFRKGNNKDFITIAVVTIVPLIFFWFIYDQTIRQNIKSVYIEELTWTEIQQAQKKGYDAIIIPTGGTEQNGAHVVTGKHNYIVHHTAGKIAKKAGRTLVAPTIAYVPEGLHKDYPGTIDIPEKLFRDLLIASGDSFANNGFKYIFFLGDSMGNQAGQSQAADILNRKWKEKGVTARSLEKYYDYKSNGQVDYLLNKGFTAKQIGGHAGLRDTSELLFVEPKAVRKGQDIAPPPSGKVAGSDGDYYQASKKIGKEMIEMKTKTGVAEIKETRQDKKSEAVTEKKDMKGK
jgi:creatinine amidohydrolase/Fe(II)-dependent formamide hydrolase-like protein